MLQAYLPSMIKRNHGHIVALSSIAGIVGFSNLVPYSATKYAVRGNLIFSEVLNYAHNVKNYSGILDRKRINVETIHNVSAIDQFILQLRSRINF